MNGLPKRALLLIASLSLIVSLFASSGAVSSAEGAQTFIPLYTTHDPIRVDSDAQLSSLVSSSGWDGSGTADDPYIIGGLRINGASTGAAIYIGNTTAHLVIRACYLSGGVKVLSDPYNVGTCIALYNTTDVAVQNNVCFKGSDYLIYLKNSDGNTISANKCNESSYHGIYLINSNGNTITNNNCSAGPHGTGILLEATCDNNSITYNLCDGDWQGIFVSTGSDNNLIAYNTCRNGLQNGINIVGSSKNTIDHNICDSSTLDGMTFYNAYDNIVSNNTLTKNPQYGIYVTSFSSNNLFFGNYFDRNSGSTSYFNASHEQAFDDGVDNMWNTSEYGNFWYDWMTPDSNGDGVVDVPYKMKGGYARDMLPLTMISDVTIDAPLNGATVTSPTVQVTGTANPDCRLVVNGVVVYVKNDGTFSVVLSLLEGENTITATFVSPLGTSDCVTVTYVNDETNDIADLEENNTALQNDLDDANENVTSLKGDLSALKSDSLPLILGALGMVLGLVAIVLVLVRKKPSA